MPSKILLEAVLVEIDSLGHIIKRLTDYEDAALKLDGSEIDCVTFSFRVVQDKLIIDMQGENLSDEIRPNWPAPTLSPVMQITFRSPEGRFTANTINKLMRRANKVLKNKAILIRDVKET